MFNRYKAVEEKAFNIRNDNRSMTTRVWINDDFELRKRKKGDTTPWSKLAPEVMSNLPAQDPKRPKIPIDMMDMQTPPTPMWEALECEASSFASVNQFNFLREEECI